MASNAVPKMPRMATAKKKDENVTDDPSKPIQYAIVDGVYVRCGQTKKTLDAGFYDVVNLGPAGYGLKPKSTVSDELIDLPGTVADEIFADIDTFMQTGERYQAFNLTHKRGYLFFGPPGSGKTSLGMMLARRFIERVGGIVMYCGDVGAFYHGVAIMRDVEPGRPSMYLIEEADAIVNNTHCLSILDGELSIQGAVFVAMTNYKNKLPPRIANRPGRFDRVSYVGAPPKKVQVEYLRRIGTRSMSEDEALETATRIVEHLDGLQMSMAHLREAFISHVLMSLPMPEIRKRFEIMAGVRLPDPSAEEKLPLDGLKAIAPVKMEVVHDEGEEPAEEYDEAREEAVYEAKNWTPDD